MTSFALCWMSACGRYKLSPIEFIYEDMDRAKSALPEFRDELLGCCRDLHDYLTVISGTIECHAYGTLLNGVRFTVPFALQRHIDGVKDCLIPTGGLTMDITSRM